VTSSDDPNGRDRPLRALIVDYGGVLTGDLRDTVDAWAAADEIDLASFEQAIRDWRSDTYGGPGQSNQVHALERGEIETADFERALATRLRTRDGLPVAADGLLRRIFAGFTREPGMRDVLRRARAAGLRTALCSNSWGVGGYPRDDWEELFDVVVISGEVGMRKPEPEIYAEVCRRLAVEPDECVFVDDLAPNVRGAVAVGMVGVHHRSAGQTAAELAQLFGLDFPTGRLQDPAEGS
jgi:epoxide hydrolase-like predicted phosphatase